MEKSANLPFFRVRLNSYQFLKFNQVVKTISSRSILKMDETVYFYDKNGGALGIRLGWGGTVVADDVQGAVHLFVFQALTIPVI